METDSMTEPASATEEDDPWYYVPPVPVTIEETGIPEPFLRELVLKTLWAHDMPTLGAISDVTGLHARVIDELVNGLNREGMCDVDSGSAQSGVQFRYRLTEKGKGSAHEALGRSRYVGVAPVPVSSYNVMV